MRRAIELKHIAEFLGKVRDFKMARDVPSEKRMALYKLARLLRKSGLSYQQIQLRLLEVYGIKASISTIFRWTNDKAHPLNFPRKFVSITFSSGMAWIAGVLWGDASISTKKGKEYIALEAADKDFVERFSLTAANALCIKPPSPRPTKGGTYQVKVWCKDLVKFLSDERNVIELLEKYPEDFIRGFFDSEGCISCTIEKRGFLRTELSVSNTNIKKLEMISEKLQYLGIDMKMTTLKQEKRGRRPLYKLYAINQRNIIAFNQRIGFTINRKREKLKIVTDILRNYGKSKRAAIEWIRYYYYDPNSTTREKWRKRPTSLSLDEAKREYEAHLRRLRPHRDMRIPGKVEIIDLDPGERLDKRLKTYFPHKEPRKYQGSLANQVYSMLNRGLSTVIIECPTGLGKVPQRVSLCSISD